MNTPAKAAPAAMPKPQDPTRKQVRGSSLLLFGRLIALGVNLLSQLLLVHHLSKQDYGAWTYALAVVAVLGTVASLGLDRTITRFGAIFLEQREYGKLLGSIVLTLATVTIIGAFLVAVFYVWPEQLASMVNERGPISILMVLIFLVPLDSLDNFFLGVFASFGGAKAIFLRRHLAGPLLKLAAVIVLIAMDARATVLAYGYLAASVAGALLSGSLLFTTLRRRGLLRRETLGNIRIPAREIISFTLPLMTTDLVNALMQSSGALMLGFFCTMDQVALYTIILPLSLLNLTAFRVFSMLYTPTASRLFVRGDRPGIVDLYWRTAAWLTVLTFPVFAVTFCMARPLVTFLYGETYARSGTYLALLSAAYYFMVATGFSGLTLRVMDKVRFVVWGNLIAALTNLGLNLVLIPRLGPLGAALSASASLVLHSVVRQIGLHYIAGIPLFDMAYAGLYLRIAACTIVLAGVTMLAPHNVVVLAALASLSSLVVLLVSRDSLRIADTFPELLRFPILRTLLAR